MNVNLAYLKDKYASNPDFIIREIEVKGKNSIYIAYLESIVNSLSVYNFAMRGICYYLRENKSIKNLKSLIEAPKIEEKDDVNDAVYMLENGYFAILYRDEIYLVEAKAEIDRGISDSKTEPNMYGSKDAFCENFQKNLGLIKRRIKSTDLKEESAVFGPNTMCKVSILYMDSLADKNELVYVRDKLNLSTGKDVVDSYDLSKLIEKKNVFPTILKTEKPAIISDYLLKGYIIVLIDNTPFAFIMNAKFKDFVNPSTTDNFIKILRFVCLILTVLTPSLYIALINFNQETIPTNLLINFMTQRNMVPFPAIIEALIMLLVCEILRETDIRFPSSYGSSASILGALVLGEASVSAGLVSPIMIIIIAITFITNLIFTDVRLSNRLRVFRIIFLALASFFGLYGISLGLTTSLILLCNNGYKKGEYL